MLYIVISILTFTLISFAQSIEVEADRLIYEDSRMIYEGKAVLKKDKGTLKADRIIVFMGKEGRAEKIVAKGNAVYKEDGKKAYAKEITHDLSKNVIILKGQAKVEEGKNYIEAEEIIYYVNTGKAIAKGNGGRVKMFYVEEEKDEEVGHSQ